MMSIIIVTDKATAPPDYYLNDTILHINSITIIIFEKTHKFRAASFVITLINSNIPPQIPDRVGKMIRSLDSRHLRIKHVATNIPTFTHDQQIMNH